MAEIKVPELAESISEGTIAKWLKNVGEFVDKGEYLVELETDKVNVEIISDYAGVLTEQKFEEGDTVNVGEAIAIVNENATGAETTAPSEPKPEAAAQPKAQQPVMESSQSVNANPAPVSENTEGNGQRPIASPAARKLAREKGIDLQTVPTADPLGRVRKQDVSSYQPNAGKPAAKAAPAAPAVAQDPSKPVLREKMSRRRQTIAKRLLEVSQSTAMLTTFNEIDMTAVMDLRKRRKDRFFEQHDVRLGFMSFFTKAVVGALKQFPLLNAEIQGEELLIKQFYDIGVAVSTEDGLIVPVVRDADRKSFAEIEGNISELAKKARDNKLALNDLQGGTFTITNGGVFGSLMSTPILNGPQVGILGMHSIKLRPVAIDKDKMENRPMMYIALSYDHRIVDGKEAVSFLAKVKEMIEDPESLLLEG